MKLCLPKDINKLYLTSILLLFILRGVKSVCSTIRVLGTEKHSSLEGEYALMPPGYDCFRRRIWKHKGHHATGFISYQGLEVAGEGWIISSFHCGNVGGIVAEDATPQTLSPNLYRGRWLEQIGDSKKVNDNISVTCEDGLGVGGIIGISVSLVIILSIILVGFIYMHKRMRAARASRTRVRAVNQRDNMGLHVIPNICDIDSASGSAVPPSYAEALTSSPHNPPTYEETMSPKPLAQVAHIH